MPSDTEEEQSSQELAQDGVLEDSLNELLLPEPGISSIVAERLVSQAESTHDLLPATQGTHEITADPGSIHVENMSETAANFRWHNNGNKYVKVYTGGAKYKKTYYVLEGHHNRLQGVVMPKSSQDVDKFCDILWEEELFYSRTIESTLLWNKKKKRADNSSAKWQKKK